LASSANRKGLEKCINNGMSFMYIRTIEVQEYYLEAHLTALAKDQIYIK